MGVPTPARRLVGVKLLVGYDGSEGGRDALGLTRLLAEASEASVPPCPVLVVPRPENDRRRDAS
jgi:nucleotide-binding universal stress UspA family protein